MNVVLCRPQEMGLGVCSWVNVGGWGQEGMWHCCGFGRGRGEDGIAGWVVGCAGFELCGFRRSFEVLVGPFPLLVTSTIPASLCLKQNFRARPRKLKDALMVHVG